MEKINVTVWSIIEGAKWEISKNAFGDTSIYYDGKCVANLVSDDSFRQFTETCNAFLKVNGGGS